MDTENSRKRRRHSAELKAQIRAECAVPGASVAKVAMAHGINANIVHGWRKLTREVIALLRRRLGQSMMGIVNYDDSFGDAVAHQQLLVDRAPVSKAAADVRGVAAAIQGLLVSSGDPGPA